MVDIFEDTVGVRVFRPYVQYRPRKDGSYALTRYSAPGVKDYKAGIPAATVRAEIERAQAAGADAIEVDGVVTIYGEVDPTAIESARSRARELHAKGIPSRIEIPQLPDGGKLRAAQKHNRIVILSRKAC